MQRSCLATAAALTLSAVALPAAQAQPAPIAPTFATMDRFDGASRVGAQLHWLSFDQDAFGGQDVSVIRTDIYGQFISPTGFGGYGILPVSRVFIEDLDDQTGIGNLEIGALYVVPSGRTQFVLRGGLTLPTGDTGDGLIANALGSYARITDIVHAFPETTTARISGSYIARSGQGVFRIDGGLDAPLASDEDPNPDPLVRLNLGGGIDTGTAAFLVEIATVGTTDDDVDGAEDRFIHTLAVSARFKADGLEPLVGIGMPLDEDFRDFYDLFLTLGIQGYLHL